MLPRMLGVLGLVLVSTGARASDPLPSCEPGFRWVEVPCWKQVERHVCKLVPEMKKVRKIVYTTKEVPFCLRRGGGKPGACTEECLRCKGPYTRKVLVKTEITCEEPSIKCVTEKVVETVPSVELRKIPCVPAPAPPLAPPLAPPPAPMSRPASVRVPLRVPPAPGVGIRE